MDASNGLTDSPYSTIPTVIETEAGRQQAMDIWTTLMKDRILMITGVINESTATTICPALLILERQDPTKDIHIFVNSPGGSVSAGLAIIDTMRFIAPDIMIVCQGFAASMGALILSAGTKGKRMAMPLSEIMIHQPWTSGRGSYDATELMIEAKQMQKTRDKVCQVLADATGRTLKQVLKDCENDNYMSADEALEYGIIDKITTKSLAKKEE